MGKRTFLWIAVAALATITVLGGMKVFSADDKTPQRTRVGMGAGMMMGPSSEQIINNPQFKQQLGLTDDQIKKIQGIVDKYHGTNADSLNKMQTLRQELNQMVETDNPDLSQVDAKIDEISKNMAVMQKSDIHMLIEVRGVLTSDQKTKLKQLQQSTQPGGGNQGNRAGRRGNRGQGGGSGNHEHMGMPGGGP